MINIFRNLFRKKKAFKPYIPAPMYGPGRVYGRPVAILYGPPPTLYGPPSAFDRPPSMAMIPGRLTVLTDPQAGRSYELIGIKTYDETIVTVGRRVPPYNYNPVAHNADHLSINDPSRTMSRMQFEIIYDLGNTYLRCRSFSNPTFVDGLMLERNQRVVLHDGSMVTAGYVQLRYDI